MKKNVMVIPGAAAQIPIIKKLKEMNYKVVCVNPYADSPAFEYADYHEQYDILNVEDCIKVAREYNVCAVFSDECDIAMPTVAAVSETLGLPSIGLALAKLYTNKMEMRAFSKKSDFPCPAYRQCFSFEEAKEFFQSLKIHKMIIKPLDSNSSRGVYTITSEEDLREKFGETLSYSHSVKAVLCEEFIEGTEFTVDGIVLNGKHYSLAISKKKHYQHHQNIACELYFSHYDSAFDYEELKKQNDEYVEASGLPFGFTHAEYKFDGEKFVLIEIGARGGGNFISSHVVPAMTGIDNYKKLVEQTFEPQKEDDYFLNSQMKNRCCVLKFFDVAIEDNGKIIKAISNEHILKENSKVLLYKFNFNIGDVIHLAEDDSKRVGFYIAYGDSREELDLFMEKVENEVKFAF